MNEKMKPIVCSEFEELVQDLDRPGMVIAEIREAALVHAELCSHCAQLLTENEALDFGLQALASQEARIQISPRVETTLLQTFRKEQFRATRERTWWRVAALSTAAALLLTCGVVLREHGVASTTGSPVAQNGISAGVQANEASDNDYPVIASNVGFDGAEDAGFVALPYADDSAVEEGAVVRVSLSPSALASLGVPVVEASDTDEIPADLVVSADGTPQAIRLLAAATN